MLIAIISAVVVLAGLGLLFGLWLSASASRFGVEPDPKVSAISELLPNANCGACGYPGCSALALAITKGEASNNACPVGGNDVAKKIAKILGIDNTDTIEMVAILKCNGGCERAIDKFQYTGIEDCRSAVTIGDGNKLCSFACIGLGTCAKLCPFDAITMNDEMLPVINFEKCTGCGICVKYCPKFVLELIPRKNFVYVACNNTEKGPAVKKVCKTGCIGCNICQKNCPYGAIPVKNFLAKVDYNKCTLCGICIEKCPTDIIMNRENGIPLPESNKGKEALALQSTQKETKADN